MDISIKLIDNNLLDNFKKLPDDVKKKLKQEIVLTANRIRTDAVKEIQQGSKSGRAYVKVISKKTGRPYRVYLDNTANAPSGKVSIASAEGEAPATDTAKLVNSIKLIPREGLNAEVLADAKYSSILEEDRNRPFMQPAVDKEVPKMVSNIDKILEGALNAL